jgi:phage anti-repressor protein
MEQLDIINFTDLLESNESVNYSLDNGGVIRHNLHLFEDKTIEQFLITKDYLYNKNNFTKENFIFDLDNIWKFLKFSQKSRAKNVLEKYFILNKDYIIVKDAHTKKGSGGHNKEKILLNLDTFNLFCLKSDTEMSHKIQEYYINLEKLLIKSIREEYSKNK